MRRADECFSPSEELANTISASVGVLLSLIALIVMTSSVVGEGALHVTSAVVFGSSLIILYLSSALNHGLPLGAAKDMFHNLDLAAIYFLIAGTYTPVTLLALRNHTGYAMFAAIWLMALVGCGRKLLSPRDFETGVDKFSLVSYVVMGWMVLIAPRAILEAIPTAGILWLLGGGLAYSLGVYFFRLTRLPYHHLIWHLFVLLGSACHVVAIHAYVLPLISS